MTLIKPRFLLLSSALILFSAATNVALAQKPVGQAPDPDIMDEKNFDKLDERNDYLEDLQDKADDYDERNDEDLRDRIKRKREALKQRKEEREERREEPYSGDPY